MKFSVVRYDESYENRWDRFVMSNSINGTFLQTRNFLNYHPAERFKDASVMIMEGQNIVAAIPACDTIDDGKRCFFSHKGSTFGGIIIDKSKYNISSMEEIFPCLEEYIRSEGYHSALFRCTSDIFSEKSMDLLDYYFFKNNYSQFTEVSFYVDVEDTNDILMKMNSSRRRDYRYSQKNNLEMRRLETDDQIEDFYKILCNNLKKFDSKPVHSVEELIEFKNSRLKDIVDFYGVFYEDKMIAGAMLFYFGKKIVHAQYLAQDIDYANLYTMNFLDFNLIQMTKDKGFSIFSFGISTEDRGKYLNKGLAQFKEGFGCDFCNNRSYIKNFD